MKFGQFMSYYKRKKFIKKFYKNYNLKNSSRPFCAWKEKRNLYWKMKFLKQAPDISYELAEPSKLDKISILTSSNSFYRGFLEN